MPLIEHLSAIERGGGGGVRNTYYYPTNMIPGEKCNSYACF